MLYLRNISDPQVLMIPRDVQTSARSFSLLLTSTIDKVSRSFDVQDEGTLNHYFLVSVSLPADMAEGEYEYSLLESGMIRSCGLLILGENERASEYNKTISYEQYYRE